MRVSDIRCFLGDYYGDPARDNPSLENLAGLALTSAIVVTDFRMI